MVGRNGRLDRTFQGGTASAKGQRRDNRSRSEDSKSMSGAVCWGDSPLSGYILTLPCNTGNPCFTSIHLIEFGGLEGRIQASSV